jgi:hypothetical protein
VETERLWFHLHAHRPGHLSAGAERLSPGYQRLSSAEALAVGDSLLLSHFWFVSLPLLALWSSLQYAAGLRRARVRGVLNIASALCDCRGITIE